MKVLLKSLEELKEEFIIEDNDDYFLIIDGLTIFPKMFDLLGKIHIAEYEKETDSYAIDGWRFPSNFISHRD